MNELNDRNPDFEVSEKIENNPELNRLEDGQDYKAMAEMMEKFNTLGRAQRRKVFKPTFSANVRLAFRKPILQ
jgi:hypothetical protein